MTELGRLKNWPSGWAFDGRKNLFSPKRFLASEVSFQIEAPDKPGETAPVNPAPPRPGGRGPPGPRMFNIAIKEVAVVDIKYIFKYIQDAKAEGQLAMCELPRDALQVLDVIMSWVSSSDPDTISSGKAFYFYDDRNVNLGGGSEAWSGYKQVSELWSNSQCRAEIIDLIDLSPCSSLRPPSSVSSSTLTVPQAPSSSSSPSSSACLKCSI